MISSFAGLAPSIQTLSNGLTVILEPLPYVHSVSSGLWIKAGSANEAAAHAGISHFLEHLFFKGTTTRTSRELMDVIESKGGHMNAFTSREYTCLYAKTLDSQVRSGIEVLGDLLKNPTFTDLDKERNVILEEIATVIDTPDEHVYDVLSQRLWPGHPLGKPIAGYGETVSATLLDDVRAYKDAWYRPSQMAFVVVGNFDEAEVLDQIREEFESIPAGDAPEHTGPPEFSFGTEFVERDIAQNHITFAFPGVHVTHAERYHYDLMSSVLGGGSTSRLFDRIREQEGLAYSIYSFNSPYVTTGMVGIYAGVAHENLQKTVDLIFEETGRLAEETVSEEELNGNREQLKGGLLIALENTFNRMARMARSWMFFDRMIPVQDILDGIDAVTAADVQEAARRTFNPERCAAAILGPVPEGGVSLASGNGAP